MDENKKYKRPNSRPASLDGIVSGGRQLGAPFKKAYRLKRGEPTPSIDGLMNRSEGFHSARTSPVTLGHSPEADEAVLLDEPIVLEDLPTAKKKRRFLGSRPRLRLLSKRTGLVLASLLLLVGAYFVIKLYITERNLFRGGGKAPALAENIDINQLKGEGDGRVNILLLGIGGPGHEGPDLTDTILLASIDPINNKVALLSIPRDLWVKVPGDGYEKINAAYANAKERSRAKTAAGREKDGLGVLDQVLEPVIGIRIHYHAVVDFAAFKDTVNALGGITFNVPEQLYDPSVAWENNWNPVIARAGTQTMNGQQALLYARSRETSSDFARGERQRQVIVAIKDKVLSLGTFSNPVKISNLLSSLGNNVYTDFSLNDMTRLYKIGSKVPSKDISSLDLVTPPHDFLTTGSMNGLSIVRPKAGLFDYAAIQDYIRNAMRDSFIAKENSKIAVYNATDVTGLANSKATILKSFGYNVTTVDNAPTSTNPANTTVVDFTKGKAKYTRHYLEGRFNTKAVSSVPPDTGIVPPAGTDFVIILGNDAAASG